VRERPRGRTGDPVTSGLPNDVLGGSVDLPSVLTAPRLRAPPGPPLGATPSIVPP